MTQLFLFILLRAETGGEAIALGFVSAISILLISAISGGIKKVTAKKKDAEKIK